MADKRLTPESDYTSRIENIALCFDDDSKLRFEILKFICSNSHEVDEYTAAEMLYWQLNDFSTAVWAREKILGYLMFLEGILEIIRGQRPVASPIADACLVEGLRSVWLESHATRELVVALETKLYEAAGLFNLQMINSWFLAISNYENPVTRQPIRFDHQLLQGLTRQTVEENYIAADHWFYGQANGFATRNLAPIWRQLGSSDNRIESMLAMTDVQLTTLAAVRMGKIDTDPEEFDQSSPDSQAAVVEEELGLVELISQAIAELDPFTQTEGGIFVPK